MRRVSSEESAPAVYPAQGRSCPRTSTCGGRPGEKIRSLTFGEVCNMACSSASREPLGLRAEVPEAAGAVLPTPLPRAGKVSLRIFKFGEGKWTRVRRLL